MTANNSGGDFCGFSDSPAGKNLTDNCLWDNGHLGDRRYNTFGSNPGGSNILFGHNDTDAGSSTDANHTLLNVTLIDNIVVSEVPESGSVMLLSMVAALGLGVRRRQ